MHGGAGSGGAWPGGRVRAHLVRTVSRHQSTKRTCGQRGASAALSSSYLSWACVWAGQACEARGACALH